MYILLRSKTSSVLIRSSGLVRGSWVSGSPCSWSDRDRSMKKTRIACRWRKERQVLRKKNNVLFHSQKTELQNRSRAINKLTLFEQPKQVFYKIKILFLFYRGGGWGGCVLLGNRANVPAHFRWLGGGGRGEARYCYRAMLMCWQSFIDGGEGRGGELSELPAL